MESIHTTTHDRPIVNATDDTSALFAAAYPFAQAVCTAADRPTANSGGVR